MRRPRTTSQFYDAIDTEFAWRIKELSELKTTAVSAPIGRQRALVRACIPILYAHWEGFVKNATELWLAYVSSRDRTYAELRPCFIANGLKLHLDEAASLGKPGKTSQLVEFLIDSLKAKARIRVEGAANTKSNLSSSVFEDLALSVGVDPSPYSTKYKLIDERLLKRRNGIAHGEYVDLTIQELSALTDEVVALIRHYKNDLQNLAATDGYLAPV